MHLTGYLVFVLLFVLGIYTLKICVRDFRLTRGSGTWKPYLCALGAVLSLALLAFAAIGALLTVLGPLH